MSATLVDPDRVSVKAAERPGMRTRWRRHWPTALLGLATAVVAALAGYTWAVAAAEAELEAAATQAVEAAERAIVPVLSYDASRPAQERAEAAAYLTEDFRAEYERLFDKVIEKHAAKPEAKVEWTVRASGLVSVQESRARVLVFLDQTVTDSARAEPSILANHVTVSLEKVGRKWLLDGLSTTAGTG